MQIYKWAPSILKSNYITPLIDNIVIEDKKKISPENLDRIRGALIPSPYMACSSSLPKSKRIISRKSLSTSYVYAQDIVEFVCSVASFCNPLSRIFRISFGGHLSAGFFADVWQKHSGQEFV